jgi:hypothetical protein
VPGLAGIQVGLLVVSAAPPKIMFKRSALRCSSIAIAGSSRTTLSNRPGHCRTICASPNPAVFPTLEQVDKVCDDEGETLAREFIGGCSATGGHRRFNPQSIDPPLLAAIKDFRSIGADRCARLLRRRLQHRETLWNFFERSDLLLTPTTPCVAWDIDRALPPGHENATVWSYFT